MSRIFEPNIFENKRDKSGSMSNSFCRVARGHKAPVIIGPSFQTGRGVTPFVSFLAKCTRAFLHGLIEITGH